MKRHLVRQAIVFSAAFLSAAQAFAMGSHAPKMSPEDPHWSVPGIVLKSQEEPNWCWVAAAQAVLSVSHAPAPSQCEIAAKTLGRDCCASPNSCDQTGSVASALRAYGVDSNFTATLDYESVVERVQAGKPAILVVTTSATSRHAIVAYGAYRHQEQDYLQIFDPIFGKEAFAKSDLLGDSTIQPWVGTVFPSLGF